MISFTDFLVVVGMFLLRFGVPVAVTVGLVYLLKRLDRRWEAEARAEAGEQPVARKQAEQPATPKRAPAPMPQLPFIPPPAIEPGRPQIGLATGPGTQPRVAVRGRSESAKVNCAAPQNATAPCWQARFDAEGKIPEDCVTCDVFQRYPRM